MDNQRGVLILQTMPMYTQFVFKVRNNSTLIRTCKCA